MKRFLTARLLPLAATLRGLEVFHASAVSFGDSAIAVIGPRQSGKTSVAVHLVLGGAGFMTDDMLALETQSDHVRAHPGAGLMGIRQAEYDRIPPQQRQGLGQFSRRLEKFYAEVERENRALPLRIVYYLDRREEDGELELEQLGRPDPRLLLASSYFNRIARTPERLRAQLELCARLSQTAAIFHASVPPSVDAAELAESLATHATERPGTQESS